MRHARVIYENRQVAATVHNDGDAIVLPDGREVREDEVTWLPPLKFGTIFALGLNYAAHAKEINFNKAPEDPLVFLKGPNTLTGHRQKTRRPPDANYMHFECELAVIIGTRCKNVPRENAMAMIKGYTVANDYAIRNFLENYYRPNLRVKNRDGCTPIGPFFIDAKDVADPMDLSIRTTVNGTLTQDGNTSDMVFDIASLIAYLSSFMTLNPDDVILTGTPEGVIDVKVGDEVVTEIEGIGRLVNTIGGDELLVLSPHH